MKKVSSKELKLNRDEVLQLLKTDVLPLPVEDKHKRIEETKKDYFKFFSTYIPHYATEKTADFHVEMISALKKRPRAVVPIVRAAPRGFAKSTHISFGYVLYSICHKLRNFIIIVSATDDMASDLVEFLRLELQHNERIRQDFGDLLTESGEKNDFVANGVRVFSRAKKQMVRGFKYRQHRPDLVILDDIEKDEEAGSPGVILKTLQIIKSGLYPAIAPGGSLFIIGTIIKKKSVIGTLINSKDEPYKNWNRKLYQAIYTDENGNEKSLWESRFPLEELRKIKSLIGTLDFNREYQNNPEDDENAVFSESWIKYYKRSDINIKKLTITAWIDPSSDRGQSNDYKAIIVVGLDKSSMIYYVLHSWVKRASIDTMLDVTFRIYKEYMPGIIGYESNGFQSVLSRDYNRLAKEYGYYLPLRFIDNKEPKETRIIRVSPLVERGKILFPEDMKDDTKILIEQMLFYPSSNVHDDGPDGLAGAVKLLDTMSFEPRYTGGKKRETTRIFRSREDF